MYISFGLIKFLAPLPGIGTVHFRSMEVDILKNMRFLNLGNFFLLFYYFIILFLVVICFLVNFFISILYFIFFCFSSYLLVLMEEHSIEDSFSSIEVKLDLLHQLGQRIHNDSLMKQGVLPYPGSSNPTFQKDEELSPVKEQIFINIDGNKKMINLHE